jgi:hypothetical protein
VALKGLDKRQRKYLICSSIAYFDVFSAFDSLLVAFTASGLQLKNVMSTGGCYQQNS